MSTDFTPEEADAYRWLAACHEAGHAVIGLDLGGRCDGLLLTAGGGGLAQVADLHGSEHAFMIAAGDAAAELAPKNPKPDGDYRTPEAIAAGEVPSQINNSIRAACYVADLPELSQRFASDAAVLAQWAITGFEDDPRCWSYRVGFARYIAAKAVAANAERILTIARRLFVEGVLSGDEVTTIFKETPRSIEYASFDDF